MEITGIDRSRSTAHKEIYFVTEPELTEEVLQMFWRNEEADELRQKQLTLDVKDGCLITTTPDLFDHEMKKKIEKMLKAAEKDVAKEKARMEKELQDWFDEFSDRVDLPLLSPKWEV